MIVYPHVSFKDSKIMQTLINTQQIDLDLLISQRNTYGEELKFRSNIKTSPKARTKSLQSQLMSASPDEMIELLKNQGLM